MERNPNCELIDESGKGRNEMKIWSVLCLSLYHYLYVSAARDKDRDSGRRKLEGEKSPLEWIKSKVALERMELIMKGQFHSRRHALFLDKVR